MRPLFILSAMACAVPAVCGTRPVASIALYTQFQQLAPPSIVEAIQDEVEAVMKPMGLQFEWRDLNSARGNEAAVELAVVKFNGRCDFAGSTPPQTNRGPLGWTHMSEGIILPFSDIDCDRIRDFVQKDLRLIHPDERGPVFGRALGRVVAHELYHIFANTTKHGIYGVAKAAYTVQELLSDDFQFEERETRELQSSRSYTILEQAARASGPE